HPPLYNCTRTVQQRKPISRGVTPRSSKKIRSSRSFESWLCGQCYLYCIVCRFGEVRCDASFMITFATSHTAYIRIATPNTTCTKSRVISWFTVCLFGHPWGRQETLGSKNYAYGVRRILLV
ncbi:unnamed protein product, partial [Pylaiella littoralis]